MDFFDLIADGISGQQALDRINALLTAANKVGTPSGTLCILATPHVIDQMTPQNIFGPGTRDSYAGETMYRKVTKLATKLRLTVYGEVENGASDTLDIPIFWGGNNLGTFSVAGLSTSLEYFELTIILDFKVVGNSGKLRAIASMKTPSVNAGQVLSEVTVDTTVEFPFKFSANWQSTSGSPSTYLSVESAALEVLRTASDAQGGIA